MVGVTVPSHGHKAEMSFSWCGAQWVVLRAAPASLCRAIPAAWGMAGAVSSPCPRRAQCVFELTCTLLLQETEVALLILIFPCLVYSSMVQLPKSARL